MVPFFQSTDAGNIKETSRQTNIMSAFWLPATHIILKRHFPYPWIQYLRLCLLGGFYISDISVPSFTICSLSPSKLFLPLAASICP